RRALEAPPRPEGSSHAPGGRSAVRVGGWGARAPRRRHPALRRRCRRRRRADRDHGQGRIVDRAATGRGSAASMPLTAIREDDVDAALRTEEIAEMLPPLAAG